MSPEWQADSLLSEPPEKNQDIAFWHLVLVSGQLTDSGQRLCTNRHIDI